MNYNVIQITAYNFKTDLLQNHSANSFHIHNTSHLILMNKLPGLINFLYFFFSRTTKWFMMYYLFTSNVHEILCICESFPFLCTRESVYCWVTHVSEVPH